MTERGLFDLRAIHAGENRLESMGNLRELGVRIAIDDFGTGYSSLSYLKHWRVDVLKIDKSFVRELATDSSDMAIVSAIIAIAKHMHIEVIAEGIEAYQQAEILRGLGCHHGQGYLFARPMPASKCAALLSRSGATREPSEDILASSVLVPSECERPRECRRVDRRACAVANDVSAAGLPSDPAEAADRKLKRKDKPTALGNHQVAKA